MLPAIGFHCVKLHFGGIPNSPSAAGLLLEVEDKCSHMFEFSVLLHLDRRHLYTEAGGTLATALSYRRRRRKGKVMKRRRRCCTPNTCTTPLHAPTARAAS